MTTAQLHFEIAEEADGRARTDNLLFTNLPRTAAERTATGDPWHAIVKEEHPLRRLERPRLVVDPTPYRPSPVLRGPEHLLLEVEEVQSSAKPLAKLAQH
jgi:hypothetical protein